jgi:hypothetical protein
MLSETEAFTVRSPRWTIEYLNGGGLLQIMLLKDGHPAGKPFVAQKRGPGRFVATSSGRFSMQIFGVGDWTRASRST